MMLKRGILLFLSRCLRDSAVAAQPRRPGRPAGRQVDGLLGVGRDGLEGMRTPRSENGVQWLSVTVAGPAGCGTVACGGRVRAATADGTGWRSACGITGGRP